MKFNSLLRSLTLVIAAMVSFTIGAFTADDGNTYSTSGTTATLTQLANTANATIPATVTYDGTTYAVNSVASGAFSNCTAVTSLTIEDSSTNLTMISASPLSNLKSVYIGRNLDFKNGNVGVFSNITSLVYATIGEQVTVVDSKLFSGCTGLKRVRLMSDNLNKTTGNVFNKINDTAWLIVPFGGSSNYASKWNFGNRIAETATLSQVVNSSEARTGVNYCISDTLTVPYALDNENIDGTVNGIWVKDNNKALDKETVTGIDYVKNSVSTANATQDQSNWAFINMVSGTPADYLDCVMEPNDIIVQITNQANHELTQVTNAEFVTDNTTANPGKGQIYSTNSYVVPNFTGSTTQTGTNGKTYFFYTPRQQEYVTVKWAQYDGNNTFIVPTVKGNEAGLSGSFTYSDILLENKPTFTTGTVYDLTGIIYYSNGVPTLRVLTYVPKDAVTAVDDVDTTKEVAGKTYYNVAGVKSDEPFKGVNIVVTTYTDGTTSTAKVVK